MSKAEKFIEENTKVLKKSNGKEYFKWLTPDQARRAVEIAREELIEKFYDWLKSNVTYIHPRKGTEECITTLGKLKEAMKDE
jgi:hypothetical protein